MIKYVSSIIDIKAGEKPSSKPNLYIGRTALKDFYLVSKKESYISGYSQQNLNKYMDDMSRFFDQVEELKRDNNFKFSEQNFISKYEQN